MGLMDWIGGKKVTTVFTIDEYGNEVKGDSRSENTKESDDNPFGGTWGWLLEMLAVQEKHREEKAERVRMENAQYRKTGTTYKPDYQNPEDGSVWTGRSWTSLASDGKDHDTYNG